YGTCCKFSRVLFGHDLILAFTFFFLFAHLTATKMARSKRSAVRDPSQLSGKPLSQTLVPSPWSTTTLTTANNSNGAEVEAHYGCDSGGDDEKWVTSPDLICGDLPFTPDIIYNLTTFLLGNPNMNSSHLFRADILFDSLGVLKTPQETERLFSSSSPGRSGGGDAAPPPQSSDPVESIPAKEIPGFELKRTVVRRLIPRNPRLDRALDQTCHFYEGKKTTTTSGDLALSKERSLYVYTPHVSSKEELPFYHPLLRSLAFLYEFERRPCSQPSLSHNGGGQGQAERLGTGTLSLHFCPFPASESFDPVPTRLERTLQALLATHVRLARSTRPSSSTTISQKVCENSDGSNYNPAKDNVIPRHLIQNTYSRLKLTYAADLCRDWVEETEPSKHVFEDLAITAFLMELWRSMYGVVPAAEKKSSTATGRGA
ncbi:tRNA (uracil-O(2)-)-methyltransferase, partial [Rasamsonia emersonii CBS 393.64]